MRDLFCFVLETPCPATLLQALLRLKSSRRWPRCNRCAIWLATLMSTFRRGKLAHQRQANRMGAHSIQSIRICQRKRIRVPTHELVTITTCEDFFRFCFWNFELQRRIVLVRQPINPKLISVADCLMKIQQKQRYTGWTIQGGECPIPKSRSDHECAGFIQPPLFVPRWTSADLILAYEQIEAPNQQTSCQNNKDNN